MTREVILSIVIGMVALAGYLIAEHLLTRRGGPDGNVPRWLSRLVLALLIVAVSVVVLIALVALMSRKDQ
jgi:hypothetical protein